MGLALYLQLRDSWLLPGFCIHKSVRLLRYAWNSLNWNFCKPFADLRTRSLESESSDKRPSRDRLASGLMLETSVSVTIYLGMFLVFLLGNSFLK